MTERIKVKGSVKVYSFPSELVTSYQDYQNLSDKEKYLIDSSDNTITSSGFTIICSILAGGTNDIDYCAVGTGTPTSTALGTEVGTRVAITHKYIINNEFHMDTFYGKNDPNSSSNVLTEAGIFNASTSGTMYASKTISITKDTTITMVVAWTWSFV